MVSLVAELCGHEQPATQELGQWKTHHQESKTIDASQAAITLAMLCGREQLEEMERQALELEKSRGEDAQVDGMSQALNRLRAMVRPPPVPRARRATADGWRDGAEPDPRRGKGSFPILQGRRDQGSGPAEPGSQNGNPSLHHKEGNEATYHMRPVLFLTVAAFRLGQAPIPPRLENQSSGNSFKGMVRENTDLILLVVPDCGRLIALEQSATFEKVGREWLGV